MPRVFHCDDEPNYRSLVRVVLTGTDAGYELVGEASDGREALDIAPALAPDIVLLEAAGLTPGVAPIAELDLGLGAGWIFSVPRRVLALPRQPAIA